MVETLHFPGDWSGFGPKMMALNERQRRFVWAYLINALNDDRENGARAARDAGFSDIAGGARVRASLFLQRDDVLDAMKEVAGRELRGLAIPAVAALGRMLAKKDHPDHRKSIEMVLNRVGHPERTALDVNLDVEVTVNHTDAAIADLRCMLELRVPREKLEEVFGFSGLARYERMLAEADRRAGNVSREQPKVIEHQATEEPNGGQ